MRWTTAIWMSAALVMATSAFHLTIEHDLLDEKSSAPSGPQENTKQDQIVIPENPDVHVDKSQEELEKSPEKTGSSEQTTSTSKSPEKYTESYKNTVNVESINKDDEEGKEDEEKEDEEKEEEEKEDDDKEEEKEDDDKEEEKEDDEKEEEEEKEEGVTNESETTVSIPTPSATGDGDNGESGPETADNDDQTIVETTTGLVRGHAWRDNAHIISYIDIKYGTFKGLFEAPEPPDPWETIHEDKDHNKRCPQLDGDRYVGDLDCLTLSIFKPFNAADASVLVHIHDGNLISGSANPEIYGPEYLVSKGIILVLPNYRLGPLGFLCLQNELAPGNAALKDLALALSWVKSNIAKFGGDEDNIAVSGEGSAGALAGYLALSSMSKNNVNKVVTDSGSVLSYWAIDRNPIGGAMNLANRISGFQTWQNLNTSVLVTAAKDIVLRPCLENNTNTGVNFMVETPWTMIEKQDINKTTFMIGSAKYAGVHEWLSYTTTSIQELNEDVGLLLPDDLQFKTSAERTRLGNKVKAQYFGEASISLSAVEPLSLYFTDAAYLGPGIRTARSLVESGATVYFYEFSFVGSLNRELEAIQNPVEGAVRGDIIGYLFTQDGDMPAEDTNEWRMVQQMIGLWTTFLKTGTPSAGNIEWSKLEKASESEELWLSIATEPTLEKGLHVKRLGLWTDIYNEHFIDRSLALATSSSVYTVIVLQVAFFISFFRNAWHFF